MRWLPPETAGRVAPGQVGALLPVGIVPRRVQPLVGDVDRSSARRAGYGTDSTAAPMQRRSTAHLSETFSVPSAAGMSGLQM